MKNTKLNLDDAIFYWDKAKKDAFTHRNAFESLAILGQIGSGKSSGSGAFYARKMLVSKALYGGIIITYKDEEAEEWKLFGEQTGRKITVVNEDSGHRFNPFLYAQRDAKGGDVTNMTALFMELVELAGRFMGIKKGGGGDEFWPLSMIILLSSNMDLCKYVGLDVSIENIARIILAIPREHIYDRFDRLNEADLLLQGRIKDGDGTLDKGALINQLIEEGELYKDEVELLDNYVVRLLFMAERQYSPDPAKQRTLELLKGYFLAEMAVLSEKTRSIIEVMFSTYARPLRTGLAAEFLSTTLSPEILPERTFEGEIIVLDYPVATYGVAGLFIQSAYLSSWMAAAKRRNAEAERPVFLWIDECQNFVTDKISAFQAISRSKRVATVYLTQSISGLQKSLGSRSSVDAFLSVINHKIFHSTNDPHTVKWAIDAIGSTLKWIRKGNKKEDSKDITEQVVAQIDPSEIILQRTGGPAESGLSPEDKLKKDNIVQGIVTRGGRPFSNGRNYRKSAFRQRDENYQEPKPE